MNPSNEEKGRNCDGICRRRLIRAQDFSSRMADVRAVTWAQMLTEMESASSSEILDHFSPI